MSQVGRKLPGLQKTSNVTWVFIEVLLDPVTETKGDIIKFYNQVYLERMKEYIITTRKMKLEQGARTPVLNKSNFDALLTPGGRA